MIVCDGTGTVNTKLRRSIKMKCTESKKEYLSESVGILCCALSFIGWITQSKDDWPFVQASHGLDDIISEQGSSSCYTWKTGTEMVVTLTLWSFTQTVPTVAAHQVIM